MNFITVPSYYLLEGFSEALVVKAQSLNMRAMKQKGTMGPARRVYRITSDRPVTD
jgi:hypothetical protein